MIGTIKVKPYGMKSEPQGASIIIVIKDGAIPNQVGRAIMKPKEVGVLIGQLEAALMEANKVVK